MTDVEIIQRNLDNERRDLFAGLAMQALASIKHRLIDAEDCDDIARTAYVMADAMMEARAKRKQV